jgi:competence protein ComEC
MSGKLTKKVFADGRSIFLLYHPKIIVIKEAGIAGNVREKTEVLYSSVLPPISASLLMGMVFGAKEQFPDSFTQSLQATGVLHVIAASGMNVTFVASALLATLGLFLRRQVALIIGSTGLIFYVFLVGFQASILRATIMGLLAFGASLFGKQNIAAVATVVSGYVLLLWRPGFLFDVGFQLSFLATLGILFIEPLIPLKKNVVTESLTTTIAAQVGTLPVLLGVFGQVGMWSVAVNVLVLWIIPAVMVLGSLAAVVGLVFPLFGQLLLYPTLPLLLYFEAVVSFFGKSGWFFQVPQLPLICWVGYYCLLVAVLLLRRKRSGV